MPPRKEGKSNKIIVRCTDLLTANMVSVNVLFRVALGS